MSEVSVSEIAEALADHHIVDMKRRVKPPRNAGEDHRTCPVTAQQVLRRCSSIHGAHARRASHHLNAFEGAARNGEARLFNH